MVEESVCSVHNEAGFRTHQHEGAVLLHLYLAPKSRKAPVPTPEKLDLALCFLKDEGIIGATLGPNEYASGNLASLLFHDDAGQHLLPAECTFESFHYCIERTESFLPPELPPESFKEVTCSVCDEPIDEAGLTGIVDRLNIFPVNRVSYDCPCCCSTVPLREIAFSQTTAIARFWFRIEGASFGRLKPSVLERLENLLGLPLLVIPEAMPESMDDWAPVRRWGQ
jgi:hypothetical protein